ncbi:T6SS immunity protein Tdi1 domain-containing protein [Hymenobacter daeguensis]
MCNLDDFLATNPRTRKIKSIDESAISELAEYHTPPDIIAFLHTEGIATFRDDFFCSTLPREHFETLSEWGLKGEECHTFLKTALGSLCFSLKGKIYQLEPLKGIVYKGRFPFCEFMNLLVPMDSFMEGSYFDIYQKIKSKVKLRPDEIYGLTPALPLGGSLETSTFEVVKLREHLAFLAQLFDNKARKL